MPTPHPGNTDWVNDRLDSLVELYRPTPVGGALLRSLDLRQMLGEPGFFGSYGFGKWAGVGEAKPIGIMHELGHSYWGGFPVLGRPDLAWEPSDDSGLAPAIANYHRDILTFMAQPPDEYEILRQRLRSLPSVSARNPQPLFHSLEADIPYTTGADLSLVPPILRKYWALFLAEGPFGSWEHAAGWFQSLSPEERRVAGKFLGFEHLDLREYPDLPEYSPSRDLLSAASPVLESEERQRLTDLVEQFDTLLGDPQLDEDFRFWRGYLQDKLALHRSHPGHLSTLGDPRATEIAKSLDFLASLDGAPEAHAEAIGERIAIQPFLVNFLPAADDRTLVKLFASGINLPDAPTLQATASFVERLQRFGAIVEQVLTDGGKSPHAGAQSLLEFLDETGLENEQDLRLFLDLIHGSDRALARRILSAVDKETIQALMAPAPVHMRNLLGPDSLLKKLDITADAPEEDLRKGIGLLVDESSGNYRIDEPFLELLFEVMADRARYSPALVLRIMAEPHFPLEAMIVQQPLAASTALSSDIVRAAEVVKAADPVLAPPARIIYRLIAADPGLAAELVITIDQSGEGEITRESLAYFAYDMSRSEKFPGLPISLQRNDEFLSSLLQGKGPEWLAARISATVELYRQRAGSGEVGPEFLERYQETLLAAADSMDAGSGDQLLAIVQAAFNQ